MTKSLWGDIPLEPTIRPPVAFLKEQAVALTEQTKGLLEGKASSSAAGTTSRAYLDIVVPSIGYAFRVLNLIHGITFYPVTVQSEVAGISASAADESALLGLIEKALSSPETHKVVNALIAQVKAASSDTPF